MYHLHLHGRKSAQQETSVRQAARHVLRLEVKSVRFEVFTAVTMKKVVLWDVTPRDSCKNRRFGGTLRLLHQGDKNR
jgi:hypothetical protein